MWFPSENDPNAKGSSRFEADRASLLGTNRAVGPLRAIFTLGLPVIFLNVTIVVMQITDAWFLGQLGLTELAALTTPSMIIFVIVSFGYGLLASVTTMASHSYGMKNFDRCGQIAWIGIFLALITGLGCLLLWPIGELFHAFGGRTVLSTLEAQYFQVNLLAMTPVLVINAVANFFFAIRRTGIVLAAATAGMGLNVIFTYSLIFGKFGLPKMGFEGAAWGTFAASVVECLLIVACFLWRTDRRYLCRQLPKTLRGARKILNIGLPAGGQAALDIISWGVLLSLLIKSFGDADLSAAAILMRCMQLSFLPSEGIATIIVALVGSSMGERRPLRADMYARSAFKVIATYMSACGLLFFVFRHPIMEAFTDAPEVIAIGAGSMIFVSLAQFFDAMNLTYLHALQGGGDTRWPFVANLAMSLVILLGGGLLVRFGIPGATSSAIWLLVTLYAIAQGVCFWSRWRFGHWRTIDLGS